MTTAMTAKLTSTQLTDYGALFGDAPILTARAVNTTRLQGDVWQAHRVPGAVGLHGAYARRAARIIALDEDEHRPLMPERFPFWQDRAEYWRVRDIEYVAAHIATDAIERHVETLIRSL